MTVRFTPSSESREALAFSEAKSAAQWLQALPLTNAGLTQARLTTQLNALAHGDLKPAAIWECAEALREAVFDVQEDLARKFTHRPLPLGDTESSALENTLMLWRAMGEVYERCVQDWLDGGNAGKSAAECCQRAMDAQTRCMFDFAWANTEIPGQAWSHLHQLMRAAEALDAVSAHVHDPLNHEVKETSCAASYAQIVMVGVGSPNEWSQKQGNMVFRWLLRWSAKISVSPAPPVEIIKPPVLVDLGSERGGFRPDPAHPATPGGTLRYLDVGHLALSIKNRVILLRKGENPAHLGLGEDFVMPQGEQLLVNLYQHWCDGSGVAKCVGSIEGIHYHLTGKSFKQPASTAPTELTSKQRQEIATFGRIATRDEEVHAERSGFLLETWNMLDESPSGLRIARDATTAGKRVAIGEIFAARAEGGKAFMLTSVRWVQARSDGSVMIGLRAIPGAPMAIGVRAAGVNAAKDLYVQALMVPAVAALNAPDAVILPTGSFKAGKVMEVYSDRPWKIALMELLERGPDYERCTYGGA
jgi:cyclic-di-GMP-binding protein